MRRDIRARRSKALIAFWPNTRWWIPGKFGHVTIIDRFEGVTDTWLFIEIDRDKVDITPVWQHDVLAERMSEITAECTVVSYEGHKRPAFLAPMTCVSFARHYVGVPSRALFPDGLLRDLLRNGGEVIHEGQAAAGE